MATQRESQTTQSDIACCDHNVDSTMQPQQESHVGKEGSSQLKMSLPAISFVMLIAGILVEYVFRFSFFKGWVSLTWYFLAYIPVGLPVIKKGVESIARGEFFTEFFLMSIATIGAFVIAKYPEAVAVMLFYAIGELFQDAAVNRAKRNIKALMDIRPKTAQVFRDGKFITVSPESVQIGERILIKPGERVPLDGEMLTEGSSFNTSALTGESKRSSILTGAQVFAGMINIDKAIELRVTQLFEDSSLARILHLVQKATQRKAKTELFIRKFAKVYTPIVVFLAFALVLVPSFIVEEYVFSQWLYRALIFLVIACPCALVISIPLGYFGGIGAASRHGILFKGSNYLDLMAKVNTLVMDKTGTLTKGVFTVLKVESRIDRAELLQFVTALEKHSTHPIAKAIVEYIGEHGSGYSAVQVEEISGHGLKGMVAGKEILAGNNKLMEKYHVPIDLDTSALADTIVFVARERKFVGYITIGDEIKEDASIAISSLRRTGMKHIVILSGDKQSVVNEVSKKLGIAEVYGDLLPEQKVEKVEALKRNPDRVVGYVGDGINDAPVLALADIGIAMGGLGSDAAIETADVVIQTDQPSKIVTARKISQATKHIVWQNISLAFGVKLIVLILGAGGLATMWEAVFADVGVALLSIVNAVRLQRMTFK